MKRPVHRVKAELMHATWGKEIELIGSISISDGTSEAMYLGI